VFLFFVKCFLQNIKLDTAKKNFTIKLGSTKIVYLYLNMKLLGTK